MKLWFGGEAGPEEPSSREVRRVAGGLRELASEEGIDEEEYVKELHEEAWREAESDVEEAEDSLENRLSRKVQTANSLREWSNRLEERLEEMEDVDLEFLADEMAAQEDRVRVETAEMAAELAPNVSSLATPRLAAELLELAGGLEELARMPSSTVQVLGAEEALFRHLGSGSPPPKHGILHRHPDVRGAGERRGEVARALAAKIAIAARIDAFGGRDETESLVREWEERLEEVG